MKTKSIILNILFALIFSVITSSAQTVWGFGAGHSNICFAIQWNEYSFRTGEFKDFSGKIESPDSTNFNDSKVTLTIKNSGIDVINNGLNHMLMGAEYLDSLNCPEITFTCDKMKKTKKNKYKAEGILTVKCKPVKSTFLVEYTGMKGKNAYMKVTGTLYKKDFGITGGGDRLGDIINITAFLELNKPKKQ
ncbi:MAG: YceI family protein [Bacteroidota bacterium]|nr:YceI family protein [Bacteroidota bacterium]